MKQYQSTNHRQATQQWAGSQHICPFCLFSLQHAIFIKSTIALTHYITAWTKHMPLGWRELSSYDHALAEDPSLTVASYNHYNPSSWGPPWFLWLCTPYRHTLTPLVTSCLEQRPELQCDPIATPLSVTTRAKPLIQTYLFMYFGPILYFSYYHSHNGTSVGCSKGEELLVGCDITIPWVWVPEGESTLRWVIGYPAYHL